MSATRVQVLIAEAKKELLSAAKKTKFFRTQYRKHRVNSPDLAASIQVLRTSAVKKVVSLRKEIRDLTGLLKRYVEVEARRKQLS
jgi:hypothetical protein